MRDGGSAQYRCVKKFGFFLRICMFTYQVTHAVFIYKVLVPYHFKDNDFMTWCLNALLFVSMPLLIYAHCVTSGTKSKAFKRQKQAVFMNHKEKVRYQTCDKCNDEEVWKPFRTKHCKVQKGDVTRFDHFCPVTMNTIGHRNHSAFLKTAVLHFMWSIIWLCLFYSYFFNEVLPLSKYPSSTVHILTVIGTTLDNLFMVLIACMGFGVSTTHSYFAIANLTTLDHMSMTEQPSKRTFGSFNFGWLFNVRQFFPSPLWMCWWPMAHTSKYEGYYFPQLCIPKEFFALKAMQIDFQYVNQKEIRITDKDIVNTAKDFYRGKQLRYAGESIWV